MNEGLCTLSVRDISTIYDVTERAVHRWLNDGEEPCPRYREGDNVTYALADLLPRIPRDPAPLLSLDQQRTPACFAAVDLGLEVAKRSQRICSCLKSAQRSKLAEVQSAFREAVARALWEKVLYLDSEYLAQALLLHPTVIHAVFSGARLPEEWETFCIDFALKNSSPKTLWRLAKAPTYEEARAHA